MADKPAPSVLRIVLMLAVAYALIVGVQLYFANKKLNSPTAKGSNYSAAIADHEFGSADGPMNDAQKVKFVEELKAARLAQAQKDLSYAKQKRDAADFNRKVSGIWRTVPDAQGRSYEMQLGLYQDQFMSELRQDVSSRDGAHKSYKIATVLNSNAVRVRQGLIYKIQPCSDIIEGHRFTDCLTIGEEYRTLEVAYKDRSASAEDLRILKQVKASTLQDLNRYGENQTFTW